MRFVDNLYGLADTNPSGIHGLQTQLTGGSSAAPIGDDLLLRAIARPAVRGSALNGDDVLPLSRCVDRIVDAACLVVTSLDLWPMASRI